jgi:hypothetical protein
MPNGFFVEAIVNSATGSNLTGIRGYLKLGGLRSFSPLQCGIETQKTGTNQSGQKSCRFRRLMRSRSRPASAATAASSASSVTATSGVTWGRISWEEKDASQQGEAIEVRIVNKLRGLFPRGSRSGRETLDLELQALGISQLTYENIRSRSRGDEG